MSPTGEPSIARRVAHAALIVVAALPLLVAFGAIRAVEALAVLADRVWPGADRGNCWTWALLQHRRHGGYLFSRPVRDAQLAWVGEPPHVGWVERIDGPVMQTEPVSRYRGRWLLLRWVYFQFTVKMDEAAPACPGAAAGREV